MNILILIISLFFSLVFYFFYLVSQESIFLGFNLISRHKLNSITGNLLVEVFSFLVIGGVLFLYFSNLKSRSQKINKSRESILDKKIFINYIILFFKNYIYYFGFLFLYLGIYFLYSNFYGYNFSYLILIINSIFFILFFINSKFELFRNFIKVNTILFSIFYLILYLVSFFTKDKTFCIVDFINSLFVISSFLLVLYNDKKILNYKKFDEVILSYFFIFLLFFLSYLLFIISNFDIFYIIFFVSSFLSILSFYFLIRIEFLQKNIFILRAIGIIFSYFVFFMGIYILLFDSFNKIIFLIFLFQIYFNIKVHKNFENYISFGIANFGLIFTLYFLYSKFLLKSDDGIFFLILSLSIPLEYIMMTYFFKLKYQFDYYFLHIFSYIFNFISIIFYLIYFKFDFFILGIIFFIESFYIFLSYFKLKKIS